VRYQAASPLRCGLWARSSGTWEGYEANGPAALRLMQLCLPLCRHRRPPEYPPSALSATAAPSIRPASAACSRWRHRNLSHTNPEAPQRVQSGFSAQADPWPARPTAVRCSSRGQARGQSIDDRGSAPCGHLWRALTSIRLQSRGRHFGKALGTASFARPLPRKRCGPPRPGQNDFGCIDILTVKDAPGSMHWDVDNCPVPMQLDEPAAVDGPKGGRRYRNSR
jgi:hypothetical protein